MSTLNQAMLLDGQALSNNDPNMVITLKGADAAKVEITSIGNDSITYSFKEGVPTDTLYDLSLSFVYKELYSLDVPLSLVNLGTVKDWEIIDTPIAATCWERSEALPFKVMKGEEDITSQLVDVSFVPKSVLKAGDTGAKSWTIESETAFSATTLKVMYTFRLPDDLPEVTRTYEGTFNIAEYDGLELKVVPLSDPIKIPVGTPSPVKFSIKYRNYRDATPYVRYVQAEAVTAPITYSSQDLKAQEQEIWVNFSAPSSAAVDGVLVFRANNASSVLGKDKVILNLHMRGYFPGLIFNSRDPAVLTGKQNQEVQQTITISMDGEQLSMEDVTIEIANSARLSVVSKVGKVVTFKILDANNTGADINNFTNVTYSYGGLSVTQTQSIIVKSLQQVTVTPSTFKVMNIPRQSLFDYPMTVSDGNGVEYSISDPKVKINVQTNSASTGSFIEKYDEGFIGKLIYTGGAQTAGIIYDVTIDGVPGTATASVVTEIINQPAVTDCTYFVPGDTIADKSLPPNQETVQQKNKYQIGNADVTIDKVLLSKYVNNPTTGNAIIEMLSKPTSTDNINFTRNTKTGWTGSLAEMTEYVRLPGGSIVYKATGSQMVVQAPREVTVLNNVFDYLDGKQTVIPVTMTQERLGQADWNFATSTDIRNISVSGSVKSATVINTAGTFNITVTGKGIEGEGSVTFSVVENGVHYAQRINLVAAAGINVSMTNTEITGMSNTDIVVTATAKLGSANLGDVVEVTSSNTNVNVVSVSTVDGVCTVTLKSVEGAELAGVDANLTFGIKAGEPGAGTTSVIPVKYYITSLKLIAYNLPHYVSGRAYEIGKGLVAKGGAQAKTIILKDGVKMDPRAQDIDIVVSAGTDPLYSEYVGIGADGNVYIKVRLATPGIANNRISVKLISDPSYVYVPTGDDGLLRVESTSSTSFNAIANIDVVPAQEPITEKDIVLTLRSGVDNTVLNPYVLIWSKNYGSPMTGNAFYNMGTNKPTPGPGGYELTSHMKFGHTGDRAAIKILVSDKSGIYRNGMAYIDVGKSPIVVVNNGDAMVPPNATTSVTLNISQKRWEDPAYNLTGATLINPTVANNLFTVANMVNNNDGTITFDVTTVNEGTAKLSFTVKDGEFEYPASIDLTVGWMPLSLGDGFIKDVEGNSAQNVTVVQQVKIPE